MKKLVVNYTIVVLTLLLVVLPIMAACTKSEPAPTPAPTPSPLPAPVPVPSPPPTSAPHVLFSDDFSNEASGWDTFEDENGWVIYEGGWLHLTNYTYAEYDTYSCIHKEFSDFILEVETKLVDGTVNNLHGVYCRADSLSEGEILPCYVLGISADGYYAIQKVVEGEIITLVSPTRSIHINKGRDVVNLMRIECIGSNLRLAVNGHVLTEVQDDSHSSGVLALVTTAWTEQDGKSFSEVAFDNIVVTAP